MLQNTSTLCLPRLELTNQIEYGYTHNGGRTPKNSEQVGANLILCNRNRGGIDVENKAGRDVHSAAHRVVSSCSVALWAIEKYSYLIYKIAY